MTLGNFSTKATTSYNNDMTSYEVLRLNSLHVDLDYNKLPKEPWIGLIFTSKRNLAGSLYTTFKLSYFDSVCKREFANVKLAITKNHILIILKKQLMIFLRRIANTDVNQKMYILHELLKHLLQI